MELALAILDGIMKRFQWIRSGMELSFNMARDTGKEAVRRYWCPEHNLSTFIIVMYMKAALEQVGIYYATTKCYAPDELN